MKKMRKATEVSFIKKSRCQKNLEKSKLKRVWHEIFDFKFFSWISVSQGNLNSNSKIHGDIREFMFINVVNKNLLPVSLTPVDNLYFPSVVDTVQKKPKSLKFIAGVNDTAEKLFTGDTSD